MGLFERMIPNLIASGELHAFLLGDWTLIPLARFFHAVAKTKHLAGGREWAHAPRPR